MMPRSRHGWTELTRWDASPCVHLVADDTIPGYVRVTYRGGRTASMSVLGFHATCRVCVHTMIVSERIEWDRC